MEVSGNEITSRRKRATLDACVTQCVDDSRCCAFDIKSISGSSDVNCRFYSQMNSLVPSVDTTTYYNQTRSGK